MEKTRKKWQCVSGSALKLMAALTMLVDHVAYFILQEYPVANTHIFTLLGESVTVYYVMRTVGRLSFPLYCFLLTEGFAHTKDRRRYGINLLVLALITELPWNFLHSGGLFYGTQNVMFTLLFGYCALYMLEEWSARPVAQIVGVLSLLILSYLFRADYGYLGYAAIIAMYLLRRQPLARAVVCTCIFSARIRAGLAFIPITLYNGERGFIRGRAGKYAFYALYPAHLLIFAILKFYIL